MEDSDYCHFLNNLDKFGYLPEGDHEDEDEDEDEEELDKDPEYKFFCDNLEQDKNGESYSVAIPISSDISIVLRYEEKEEESFENVNKRRNFTSNATREKAKVPETSDGFSGKARVGRPETVKKTMEIRNDRSKKKLSDVPVQERNSGDDEILIDVPEILASFPGKARVGRPKTVKKTMEIRNDESKKKLRDVPVQERNSGDDEILIDVPETLGSFPGKARVGRPKTVKKTMEIRNDESKKKLRDVTIQERNSGDDEILIDVPETLGNFSGKARVGRPKTVKKPLEIRDEGCKKNLRDVPSQERKSGDNGNKRKEIDEVDPVSCKSSGDSSKMMNCVVKKESSDQFSVSLDKSDTNSEPRYAKGHTSSGTHPKNDGSCSDVEVFTLDNMPFHEGDYTPFVPSKCYQPLSGEEFGDGIRSSNQSLFREKLMDLLKIPYDGHELSKLLEDVTKRKPVEGIKELRGRTKSYSTKTIGRSYLDWYKELGMKIDEFKHDQHKVLCLLRGFFFWLKPIDRDNCSHLSHMYKTSTAKRFDLCFVVIHGMLLVLLQSTYTVVIDGHRVKASESNRREKNMHHDSIGKSFLAQ